MVKTIFFGTQNFAASILEALLKSGNYEISAVVTQPDRPVGRSQELEKSPVKILAEKHNLNILQPESLKNQSSIFNLQSSVDLFIVCQYGLIIPKQILDLPERGSINVHTSLLPKYRGASPIQTALINGETETGITTMLMDEKMDRGPILAQEKVTVDPDDTTASLSERMAHVAANLLLKTIPDYLSGKTTPKPQDETQVTFCKILTRDDGKIDFSKTADEIYNLYRGLTPWPGIWTTWNGKRLKLLVIKKSDKQIPAGQVAVEADKIFIGTNQGSIEVLELQLEGKKAMDAKTFLSGYKSIDKANLNA